MWHIKFDSMMVRDVFDDERSLSELPNLFFSFWAGRLGPTCNTNCSKGLFLIANGNSFEKWGGKGAFESWQIRHGSFFSPCFNGLFAGQLFFSHMACCDRS